MQSVRRRSLIDDATASLRDHILRGEWEVGERIPNETDLAGRLSVGRNTVREAVQTLVHLGLLQRRQGSGTYVLATSEVAGSVGRLFSPEQRRELVELRLALDASAAALAAQRRTARDITALRQALEDRLEARDLGDLAAAAQADAALHRAVVAAAHNGPMLDVYDSILPTIAAGVRQDMGDEDHGYDPEHEDIVAAIEAGDSDRATEAARTLLLDVLASGK